VVASKTKETKNVPNRFELEILHRFRIRQDRVLYRFFVVDPENDENEERENFWKSEGNIAPPYIAGLVSQLINLVEIPKTFRFGLQYISVEGVPSDQASATASRGFAISYDVVFAGDKALRSATFDILDSNGHEEFEKGQLLPTFEKLYGRSQVGDIPSAWRSAGFIDHEVEILTYGKLDLSAADAETILHAKSTTTFRRSPYGEYASAYLLPRFDAKVEKVNPIALTYYYVEEQLAKADGVGKDKSALVVSNRQLSAIVQQNLEALELGMSAPTPKIVFIQGEPGSGKDGFANAIHLGSRLDLHKKHASPFHSRSVAGMNLNQFHIEVLGEMKDGVLVPGLITKSKGGSIFLDEFDKLSQDADAAYSELLRIWEAEEFVPVNGREVLPTEKINWIVAGAFTSTRTTSDLPPDIWSRFTAQIALQSPISSAFVRSSDRAAYVRALIFSFMLGIAAKRVDKNDFRCRMQALCRPKTRVEHFAGSLLFKDPRKGQEGDVLEPSLLMTAVADVLSQYLGAYWVCVLERTDPKSRRGKPLTLDYCCPRRESVDDVWRYITDEILRPDVLRELARTYGRAPELLRVFDCYDSVRAVRQACQVAYDRLFELVIQKAPPPSAGSTPAPPPGPGPITAENIRKLLNETFTTVDLARQGTGLEKLLGQEGLQKVRFGVAGQTLGSGIVSPEKLQQIADLASAI
jgi:hypothetical protein